MQKTVLLPTDYSIESLNALKRFMATEETPVHVIFLYCMRRSDSIIDLLFGSSEEEIDRTIRKTFNEAWGILRSKYASRVLSFRVEIFCGITQNSFQNFLDANAVTEIVVPREYKFLPRSRNGVDPMTFIRRCSLPKIEVSWPSQENVPEKSQLAELFVDN